MKKFPRLMAVFLAIAANSLAVMAQSQIYRCGNEYLNDAALAVARGCQVVEGGNVTVVPGTRVNRIEKDESGAASLPARSFKRSLAVNGSPHVTPNTSSNTDARSILLTELTSAETRLADQQKEYNNGQPEKLDAEKSNPQRYRDRVNELKEGVNRYTADIAGLKREIARLPTTVLMPGQSAP